MGHAALTAVELIFRPPYAWEALLSFVARRAARGVEAVVDGRYVRSIGVGGAPGWLAVGPGARPNALRLEVAPALAGSLPLLAAAAVHAFDLDAEPQRIAASLGDLAAAAPGLRVPGTFDGFELAVRAVLGQQVSVKAASTLAGRLANAFGERVETPFPEITRRSPTAAVLAARGIDDLVALGVTKARSATILALARSREAGALPLAADEDPEAAIAALVALPGIGDWTAQYVAMRALSWSDAFPSSDLAILKALGETSARRASARAEAWRPWRAYAAMHLWRSLEPLAGPTAGLPPQPAPEPASRGRAGEPPSGA